MTVYCTECEQMFDSHDGGTIVGEKSYCPFCEEILEQRAVDCLRKTWDMIADGVMAMENEMGNSYASREVVMEMCLDAGRPERTCIDIDAAEYLETLSHKEQIEIAKQAFPLSRYC